MDKSSIYPEKRTKTFKTELSFKINFWTTANEKGVFRMCCSRRDTSKGGNNITSLHSYLKRSMPETLFRTLTNLLDFVQKQFLVRTLIRQNRY